MNVLWDTGSDGTAFEDACWANVFNARRPKHRRPRAVAKIGHTKDVVAAVKLAIEAQLRVAVRSGGHSFEVWSMQNDSILLDMSNYRQVDVDPAGRTLTASPGTTGKELNSALAVYGLFFPGGHCPDVGLGGFLLQGGMGWNCANWGWASEFVLGIEAVTAQGCLVYCDVAENADLFWAARGSGPAFPAVVTRFHLRAVACPQVIRSSCYVYPSSRYEVAFRWAIGMVTDLDVDTEITAKSHYRQSELCFSIIVTTFKNSIYDSMQVLQPIEDARPTGALCEFFCTPESMDSLYAMQAKANPKRHRYMTDSCFLDDRTDLDVVSTLADAFLTLPHEKSFAFWTPMRPWSRRQIPEMALSLQGDHYFAVYTVWENESDDERCQSWLRSVMNVAAHCSVGAYIGDSELANRHGQYWSVPNMERLEKICRKWDPEGRVAGGYAAAHSYCRCNFCREARWGSTSA